MRLINADKLLMHLADYALSMSGKSEYCTIQSCVKAVEEQPTIDPVKHGRWRYNVVYNWGRIEPTSIVQCSVCGWNEKNASYYCPNCGAKMDGEADHDDHL